jgi:leucyl/phenylalanyl-tRNA--protein transferase
MRIYSLDHRLGFPDPAIVSDRLPAAVGGDLSPERLLLAYRMGYFPWYNEDQPILWYHPDPRYLLPIKELKIAKSMRPILHKKPWKIKVDTQFLAVLEGCAGESLARPGGETWLGKDMMEAYLRLHEAGWAHSIEVWDDQALVGGLYGVSLGRIFFGESMFTRVPNASKYGFIRLVLWLKQQGFEWVDCQMGTDHLIRFGARPFPRDFFVDILNQQHYDYSLRGKWTTLAGDF